MIYSQDGQLKSVTVVVPARNEARNISWVLERMPVEVDEVVLVDGSSSDGTVAEALKVRSDLVVAHQTRKGKGNALACGFEVATGDFIVMIDADGSMDPAEITRFLAPLAEGAHYVKGTRFASGGGSDDITTLRRLGNSFLNTSTNVLFGCRFSDLCYGFNAFSRECLEAFTLPQTDDKTPRWGDGFEIESMINIRIARSGADVFEVPSYEYERRYGASNLNTFRDGFRVLRTILSERLAPAPRFRVTERSSIDALIEATPEVGEPTRLH